MSRLIDADALWMDIIHAMDYCDDILEIIEQQPTVEQKTGKWKPWKAYYGKDHKSWSDELKCSECGYKWGDEEYKFCPMCQAKIEGVEDD